MSEETMYLPDAVSVDRDGLSGFDSGSHLALHDELCKLVEDLGAPTLNMPADLLARWRTSIEKEVGNGFGKRASLLTKQLAALDKERVQTLVYLYSVVNGQRRSLVKERQAAADRIEVRLRKFSKVRRSISRLKRTASIGNIVEILEELPTEVQRLDLEETLRVLKAQNEEYQALMTRRSQEQQITRRPPMSEVRPETDEAYAMVCRYVEASYLLTKTREVREKIYDLVLHINQTTARHRAGFRESRTKRRLAKLNRQATQSEAANEAAEGEA